MNKRNQIGNIFFSVCMHFMLFFAISPAICLVIYFLSISYAHVYVPLSQSSLSLDWFHFEKLGHDAENFNGGRQRWRPVGSIDQRVNSENVCLGDTFHQYAHFYRSTFCFTLVPHYTWMKTWCKRTHKTHLHLWVMSLVSTTKTMTTAHRHRQLSIEKTFIMIMFASLDTGRRQ